MTDPTEPTDQPEEPVSADTPGALGSAGLGRSGGAGGSRRGIVLAAGLVVGVGLAVGLAVWGGGEFEMKGGEDGGLLPRETVTWMWGNRYQVVSTKGKRGADRKLPTGRPELTMTFAANHDFSFTGCNGGSGRATLEGTDGFRVGSMASTMMACIDPDGQALMEYDTWVAGVIEAGVTVSGSATDPVLHGRDGSEIHLRLIGAAPEPAPQGSNPDEPVSSATSGADTPAGTGAAPSGDVSPPASGG